MIKAVVFDLDDTLISERKYIESGYLHISKVLCDKYHLFENELYQLLIDLFNESPKYVFNRLLDRFGIIYTHRDIQQLIEEYRNHIPSIEFYNDVLPNLEVLKQEKIKIGIITDGYANAQRQKLNALKAHCYFDEIIVTDELGREYWKPHPRSFEIIKSKLNVDYNEMIYIGDNPEKDFYISSIYPIKTIRINRCGFYSDRSYFRDIRESQSIISLNDLKTMVEKFDNVKCTK
ncbi:HAD family hydrolase [Paenibacillus aceti]|uniref:Haloacid dehalogenase n=1 Tax=Paenibacillus aceti TaxID=1820010 RepID=A0ABQ1VTX5_9BACL|nr:HAD-IA family hydrolase [Paenibacillus aceti]GGF96526.1 haloacid dehalogenase [Paenibacillus aceti]